MASAREVTSASEVQVVDKTVVTPQVQMVEPTTEVPQLTVETFQHVEQLIVRASLILALRSLINVYAVGSGTVARQDVGFQDARRSVCS